MERTTQSLTTACTGLLSLLTCCLFLLYAAVLNLRFYFRKQHDYIVKPTALVHLQSQFGFLFLNLIFSDVLQSVAFASGFHWSLVAPPAASTTSVYCSFQGALIAAGDVACAFSSMAIALHTSYCIFYNRKPKNIYVYLSMLAIWILVLILGICGPLAVATPLNGSFYAFTGIWCFISSSYQSSRLWFHYIHLLFALFLNLIVYALIFVYLHKRAKTADEELGHKEAAENIRTAALRMLLYPLANAIIILPIASIRLATMAGGRIPLSALNAAGVLLSLSGFINCLLYSFTRNIIPLSSSKARPITQAFEEKNVKVDRVEVLQTASSVYSASVYGASRPVTPVVFKVPALSTLQELKETAYTDKKVSFIAFD